MTLVQKTFLKIHEGLSTGVFRPALSIYRFGPLESEDQPYSNPLEFFMKKLIAALIASMFAVGAFAADAAPAAAAPEASAAASKPAKKVKHHAKKKAAHKAEAASAAAPAASK